MNYFKLHGTQIQGINIMYSRLFYFNGKLLLFIVFIFILLVTTKSFSQASSIQELKKNAQSLNQKGISVQPSDPWTIDHVITAEELSNELKSNGTKKPLIYHVGFDFFYKQSHIPGSVYIGPANKQQGLDKIKNEVKNIKHDQYIVIYCGCCPWKDCPNIRQAYNTCKELGFTNVKVLYIPNSFAQDWKNKGYAIEGKNQ
jgi:hypothetical protein